MKRNPEPYSKRRGRWVGCDGFVVPKTFGEFYSRYPNYISKWVSNNLYAPAVYDRADVEEWSNELLLHLMVLPAGSIHRTRTIKDVVAAFNPDKCEGASQSRFFRYIDFCLMNRFRDVWSRQGRDFLRHTGSFPLNSDGTLGSAFISSQECRMPDLGQGDVLRDEAIAVHEQEQRRVYLEEYRSFVAAIDPDLLSMLDAIANCVSLREARASLDWPPNLFNHGRDRLQTLARCFRDGSEVPPRRKLYKAREATPAAPLAPQAQTPAYV